MGVWRKTKPSTREQYLGLVKEKTGLLRERVTSSIQNKQGRKDPVKSTQSYEWDLAEYGYDPNEPRASAGTPKGGQWIAMGGHPEDVIDFVGSKIKRGD